MDILTEDQLRENWQKVWSNIEEAAQKSGRDPNEIKVVAVTKTHPTDLIKSAVRAGIKVIGENYAQELRDKQHEFVDSSRELPEWHFIGHLQRNKVKYIAPFVEMIHTVDSERLAREIDKQAAKNGRKLKVLLQVNTSGEESKFGCEPTEIFNLAEAALKFENLEVQGLMTIGSFADDEVTNRREFSLLRKLRDQCAEKFPDADWHHLSMGMTHDYPIAVDEGSTIVRVGQALFGPREEKCDTNFPN